MVRNADLPSALDAAGCRVTGSRRAVADLIASRPGHFTAADLLDQAQTRGVRVGRATVFRALDLFTTLGVLERLDLPGGEHAYVACQPARHHHHIVCSACGSSVEVEDDFGLEAALTEAGRRTGFRIASHRLELYGLCSRCRARAGDTDA